MRLNARCDLKVCSARVSRAQPKEFADKAAPDEVKHDLHHDEKNDDDFQVMRGFVGELRG